MSQVKMLSVAYVSGQLNGFVGNGLSVVEKPLVYGVGNRTIASAQRLVDEPDFRRPRSNLELIDRTESFRKSLDHRRKYRRDLVIQVAHPAVTARGAIRSSHVRDE